MEAKAALRAALAQRRAEAAAADPLARARLIGRWPLPVSPGQIVAGYVKFRTEIDPAPLMAWLFEQGARLCLPATPLSDEKALRFFAFAPGDALAKGRFGVWEPMAGAAQVRPDIVLVPLLGFDLQGHRLGYGQGHYDRALCALRSEGAVTAVGLGYACQGVLAVPAEPHDQRLDWVLTPDQSIQIGA